MAEIKVVGSLDSKYESTNRIYETGGVSPALNTMQGGNREPKILEKQIVAMRGRNPDNPSDRTAGAPTQQRLEPNSNGICNTLTSVQKDNMVLENMCIPKVIQKARGFNKGGSHELSPPISASSWQENNFLQNRYRIRKLTPRECGRLMDVTDEDISKMEAVNSNSQLYKQFGNSIVVAVMVAMFKNLNIEQE